MVPSPAGGMSASSSAAATGTQANKGDIYGGSFSTGYFGRGTDFAGILEKGMIPIVVIGVVALLWMLKNKK